MKKKMLMLLAAAVLLTGCGRVDDIARKPSETSELSEAELTEQLPAETVQAAALPAADAVTKTDSRADETTATTTTTKTTTSTAKKSGDGAKSETAPETAAAVTSLPAAASEVTTTTVSSVTSNALAAATQIHLPDQPAEADIFDRLNSLEYKPVTCDGLPEYTLTAPDGTYYRLNLSGKWAWRNFEDSEALLTDDIVEWLEKNGSSVGLARTEYLEPDTAAKFNNSFIFSLTRAEFSDFDGTRYVIDGENIQSVQDILRSFGGTVCAAPDVTGWYSYALTDKSGNTFDMGVAGKFLQLSGICYYDPDTDISETLAEYFRADGTRIDSAKVTNFELVKISGSTVYVTNDMYGLVSFPRQALTLETAAMRSGVMLRVTWSGDIAESYPGILGGVKSAVPANDLAQPDRPDFVGEHLDTLIEACRGKEDHSEEVIKLAGLSSCEKAALLWLAENELNS